MGDDVHYTVLVRLPFPRGDFVDPPPVFWNSERDNELWDLLAKTSAKGLDLDWQELADKFEVSLPFLTQQAAWLYERQLSQVRAQLRKVNKPPSVGATPTPGSISGSAIANGQPMTRGGSGGGHSDSLLHEKQLRINPGSRVPSSLSHRSKERTASRGDGNADTRGYPLSRTASTNTVTQITRDASSASPHSPNERRPSFANQSREASRKPIETPLLNKRRSLEKAVSPSAIASSSSSSSSSESDGPHPISRSRVFAARRPRYSSNKAPLNALSDADEEEDEDSPPFLPFSAARATTPPPVIDPGATVKISPKRAPQHQQPPDSTSKPKRALAAQTPHSSSSSAQSQSQSRPQFLSRSQHTALSTLSPKQRRIAKGGSEGTPSMGSSFSDLDDASITQSALEEALANDMTNTGMASRMSTISQALRSRYLS